MTELERDFEFRRLSDVFSQATFQLEGKKACLKGSIFSGVSSKIEEDRNACVAAFEALLDAEIAALKYAKDFNRRR